MTNPQTEKAMISARVRQLLARRALQQARLQIRKDHHESPYTYNVRGYVSIGFGFVCLLIWIMSRLGGAFWSDFELDGDQKETVYCLIKD